MRTALSLRYTDQEIQALLHERKTFTEDVRSRLNLRPKRGHKEQDLDVAGALGNAFRIVLRQSLFNSLDFSVILALCSKESNQVFRLKRHNGKSHQHTNPIEGNTFYDFHVHMATERYQDLGTREDTYAEPTDRFSDFHTALGMLIDECGFQLSDGDQKELFT